MLALENLRLASDIFIKESDKKRTLLMGFTDDFKVQIFLFLLFLAIYFFTMIGNLGLVFLVIMDSQVGFLGHYGFPAPQPHLLFVTGLSFLGALITPKMLVDFMSKNKTILLPECAAQMFLFTTFGTTECFLLAAMAYDRYVAIYEPLLYSVSMAPRVYVPLIIASYVGGILHATLHTVATFSLSFCASSEIRHVFCDIPPLLLLVFYFAGSIEISTILIVLISYGFILLAILRMCSAEGRRKEEVFSTCGSHLTGVSIFHGTVLFIYMTPSSSYALDYDMIVSVFYTIIISILNPIVYSLRNKDVKEVMKKVLGKNWFINKVYFSH
uniref:Olfactory receptor n=1 Tax=Capra hircus TaxID=9925 RepID=A0A8C2Y1L6_CAPHI